MDAKKQIEGLQTVDAERHRELSRHVTRACKYILQHHTCHFQLVDVTYYTKHDSLGVALNSRRILEAGSHGVSLGDVLPIPL